MRLQTLAIFVSAVLFFACQQKQNTLVKTVFPIDSVLTDQIKNLLAAKASINKTVLMNDSLEQKFFTPTDSVEWSDELQIFGQLSAINRPINKDAYVEQVLADTASNLTIRSLKTTNKLPLRELRIYYLESADRLKRIEGVISESNALYSSARILTLHFSAVNNKTMLTAYSVRGGQHMILGDTVQFEVNSSIQIQ